MRILQLCTNFNSGGIQRHVLDLTEWLRAHGHEVFMAGTPGDWLTQANDNHFYDLPTDGVSFAGGHLLNRGANVAAAASKLRALVGKLKPDMIHAHETAPALVARLSNIGRNIPIAYTYHGSEPERVPEVGRIARFAADYVITPSFTTARDLELRGHIAKSKLRVMGLGVKTAPEYSPAEIAELRAQLLPPGRRFLCVTIARLAPQKGLDVLIDVVRRVVGERHDVQFVVAGDGPLKNEVLTWAEKAGIAEYISFIGRTNEAYKLMAAADAFLLTSRWENLPITIVEAFRSKLPVIATDCGGVAELVDDSVGKVLPVGDVAGLAHAVLEIAGDDALRALLSENALARSHEDRFSPPFIHQKFEDFYRDIVVGND